MTKDDPGQHLVPIGTVVDALQQDYPDVSHSSLRFLEREGLITPTRTPGGHRLFARSDVQRIRQIKIWQAQRLSIDDIRQRLTKLEAVGPPDVLANQYLDHALAGDVEQARNAILTASDLGLSLDVLYGMVLRPALWELGERWASGTVTVAQEKEVSEITRDLIAELELRSPRPASALTGGVVAACVAGEHHELGLRMVSGQLRTRGVAVHFLGADVATEFLIDAVQRRRPQAVLLSATNDAQLSAIEEAAYALRKIQPIVLILAGGQAIDRQPQVVIPWDVRPLKQHDPDSLDALASMLLNPEHDMAG